MILASFEYLLDYTGQPEFVSELTEARTEFIARTDDLFESDPSFERRMSLFLEWFILDRVGHDGLRPIDRFRNTPQAQTLSAVEQEELESLSASRLTLMEFRSWRSGLGRFTDLLPKSRIRVNCPVAPIGLTQGDIVECRLYDLEGQTFVSDDMTFLPRDAKRLVLKACKSQKDISERSERVDFVHKITFLANRGERYGHVAPREIFKALMA